MKPLKNHRVYYTHDFNEKKINHDAIDRLEDYAIIMMTKRYSPLIKGAYVYPFQLQLDVHRTMPRFWKHIFDSHRYNHSIQVGTLDNLHTSGHVSENINQIFNLRPQQSSLRTITYFYFSEPPK